VDTTKQNILVDTSTIDQSYSRFRPPLRDVELSSEKKIDDIFNKNLIGVEKEPAQTLSAAKSSEVKQKT